MVDVGLAETRPCLLEEEKIYIGGLAGSKAEIRSRRIFIAVIILEETKAHLL